MWKFYFSTGSDGCNWQLLRRSQTLKEQFLSRDSYAATANRRGVVPAAPAARFGHVAVLANVTLETGQVAAYRTSHLAPRTSHLTPHTSHLTPHTSHLTPHTSHLTPLTSHLTPHTSHLTPLINTPFLFQMPHNSPSQTPSHSTSPLGPSSPMKASLLFQVTLHTSCRTHQQHQCRIKALSNYE